MADLDVKQRQNAKLVPESAQRSVGVFWSRQRMRRFFQVWKPDVLPLDGSMARGALARGEKASVEQLSDMLNGQREVFIGLLATLLF